MEMNGGNDYSTIVKLCCDEGWSWALEIWEDGAALNLFSGNHAVVHAAIDAPSLHALRRRVVAAHHEAPLDADGRVNPADMQPRTQPHISLWDTLFGKDSK